MRNQTFNIAEAKTHLSKLIERVERGEQITIARSNRPVAVLSPARATPEQVLAEIDALHAAASKGRRAKSVLRRGETWKGFVEEGRRI